MSSSAKAAGAGGSSSKRQVLVKLFQGNGKKRRFFLQQASATRSSGACWTVKLKKCDTRLSCSGCQECEYEAYEESWFSLHAT